MFDARTEANLSTLLPVAREAAIAFMQQAIPAMAVHGAEVRIISGTRTYAEQRALYAKGRTKPGRRVTNARPGYSNHNFGVAFDIGIFKGSEYLDESPLYGECGQLGKSAGLEWGGDWKSFRDEPHFQYRTGLTLAQMRERTAKGIEIV